MKRIEAFTHDGSEIYRNKNYYTIRVTDDDVGGPIQNSTHPLPSDFVVSKNKQITILNFEAFYTDPNNANNLLRSDCTEMHSTIGVQMNFDNELICLSGRGFCGYLTYDVSRFNMKTITFEYYNKKLAGIFPVYVVIQLFLESE